MRRAPSLGLILACVTLLASHSTASHASPADLFGTSARAAGLGGAVVSDARAHEAVHHNPAALGFASKLSFAAGFRNAHFNLGLDGVDASVSDAPALILGFGLPLPFGGWLKDRLALGFGFVMPTQSILVAKIPRPGTPRFALLDSRAQVASIQAALGVRITEGLSLGIGLTALGMLDGGVEVAPNADGNLGSTVKSELLASYAFHVGLLIRPMRTLAFGLTYRGAVAAEFKYPFLVDLGEGFPLPIPAMAIDGIAQYDPAQLALEVSLHPTRWLSLALGGTFKAWSGYANPLGYTAVPEDTPPQPAPGFHDTLDVRFGVEGHVHVGDWTLEPRLGLRYEPSPAPTAHASHAYLDNHRFVLALGFGTRWRFLRLDVAFQWQRALTRDFIRTGTGDTISHGGDLFFWSLELGAEL